MNFFTKYLTAALVCCFFHIYSTAQVGSTAPDFTATDTHGETHTLYDYLEAGKVVVLDFFYTTCGPCQFYSPQVNLAYEKYGCNTDGVIFMAIDWGDTNAEVIAYDAEYLIEYPSISGTEGGGNAIVNAYNITGFPTFYVIDSTKKIIDQIDPPTLQVFDFRFAQHGIPPADCETSSVTGSPSADQLKFFPNPVSQGELSLIFPEAQPGDAILSVYDLYGKTVLKQPLYLDGTTHRFSVDGLSSGFYTMKITGSKSGEIYSGTFVKQ